MLTENQIKEQLSYAHIHAIAAKAGLHCEGGPSPDMDSIDVLVRASGYLDDASILYSPRLELQVKATWRIPPAGGDSFTFQLPRKNYDDLRVRRAIPALLVVYLMPRDAGQWINGTEEELVTCHAAYWASLLGLPEVDSDSKAVTVHRANRLTPDSLRDIMVRTSRQEDITP